MTNPFVKKLIIKIIIFVIATVLLGAIANAMNTIIANYLALGQMENSDEMFVFMETYNNGIRPALVFAYTAIVLCIVIDTGIDIYNYVYQLKKNGENKNEKLD